MDAQSIVAIAVGVPAIDISLIAIILTLAQRKDTWRIFNFQTISKKKNQRYDLIQRAQDKMNSTLYGQRNNLDRFRRQSKVFYSKLVEEDLLGGQDSLDKINDMLRLPECNSGQAIPLNEPLIELKRACIAAHTLYPFLRSDAQRQLSMRLPADVAGKSGWEANNAAGQLFADMKGIISIQGDLGPTHWTESEEANMSAFVSMVFPFKVLHWCLIDGPALNESRKSEVNLLVRAIELSSLPGVREVMQLLQVTFSNVKLDDITI